MGATPRSQHREYAWISELRRANQRLTRTQLLVTIAIALVGWLSFPKLQRARAELSAVDVVALENQHVGELEKALSERRREREQRAMVRRSQVATDSALDTLEAAADMIHREIEARGEERSEPLLFHWHSLLEVTDPNPSKHEQRKSAAEVYAEWGRSRTDHRHPLSNLELARFTEWSIAVLGEKLQGDYWQADYETREALESEPRPEYLGQDLDALVGPWGYHSAIVLAGLSRLRNACGISLDPDVLERLCGSCKDRLIVPAQPELEVRAVDAAQCREELELQRLRLTQAESPLRSTFTSSYFELPVEAGSDVEVAKSYAEHARKSAMASRLGEVRDKAEDRGEQVSWYTFLLPLLALIARGLDGLALWSRGRQIIRAARTGAGPSK